MYPNERRTTAMLVVPVERGVDLISQLRYVREIVAGLRTSTCTIGHSKFNNAEDMLDVVEQARYLLVDALELVENVGELREHLAKVDICQALRDVNSGLEMDFLGAK